MKRADLVRHLEACGGRLLREGGSHSVYVNAAAARTSTVPRHRRISLTTLKTSLLRLLRDVSVVYRYLRRARDHAIRETTP